MTGRGDSASALCAERFENWVAELGSLNLNLEGGPSCFRSRHLKIDVGPGLRCSAKMPCGQEKSRERPVVRKNLDGHHAAQLSHESNNSSKARSS